MEVKLIAYNQPITGDTPLGLPLLAIKTSTGKVHEHGIGYYLRWDDKPEKQPAWFKWIELAQCEFPSVLEHITLTFFIDGISRVASHQLVRHRLVSFTQESQRYTEVRIRKAIANAIQKLYNDGASRALADELKKKEVNGWHKLALINIDILLQKKYDKRFRDVAISLAKELFVFPPSIATHDDVNDDTHSPSNEIIATVEKMISDGHLHGVSGLTPEAEFAYSHLFALKEYLKLRSRGIPMEDARFVLPQSVKTSLLATANLREWRHIINLRCHPKAQWEIRELACEVKKQIEYLLGIDILDEEKCIKKEN